MKTKEEIYRKVAHDYHIEDAKNQVENYLDDQDVDPKIFEGTFDYDYLASVFEENHDCNVADNLQWYNIIKNYISANDINLHSC